jgi:hypothetical protein
MTDENFDELAEFARLRRLLDSTYETNRWGSDPMDLMWLFWPAECRNRVADFLRDLADWVDGHEDDA